MVDAKIIIVDEKDRIINCKERIKLNREEIYRVSALWIKNSNGESLLAQRSFSKKHSPGKWGPAVAGTVEEGETYDSNIKKEAEEELGLKKRLFKKAHKARVKTKYNYFCQWYTATIDRKIEDFKIQKEEVEAIKWFSKEELIEELDRNQKSFLKSIKDCVDWFG
ncbi:MAG: NUDIX domain-containing protein [Candidatus Aenigmarchaeota archaeon]|nr:NUDIX domain-containing protein [Candidatus Aenigmarchaeota archaeon]